jgi:hypothetical protein
MIAVLGHYSIHIKIETALKYYWKLKATDRYNKSHVKEVLMQ